MPVPTRPRPGQLDITFPAWFSAALPTQGICTRVCLSRYTHVPCGTKETETTSRGGDKQMYDLESHLYFSFICWHFLFFELRDEPQSQLVSDSRRRPCAPHGSVRLPCTSAAGSTPAPRCVLTHFITSRRASPSITRPTALDAGEVHVGGVTRAPITPAPPAPMPDGSTVTLL